MRQQKYQQGVALLEVLIAIGVMAFGFLALLKLQITSLNNVVGSNQRYVAVELAQTMGERIRANSANAFDYNGIDTRTFTNDCSSGCTKIQDNDVYLWKNSLNDVQDALPGGYGLVAFGGNRATVTITWQEKHSGKDATEQSYLLEVPIHD